jgi:multisubunit Na+/H+ antiporter MnhC subunit
MKTNEFHKPFIDALILVAIVTVFTMATSKYIVRYYIESNKNTIEFTSDQSQFHSKSSE